MGLFDDLNDIVLDTFRTPSVTIGGIPATAVFDRRYYADDLGESGGAGTVSEITVKSETAAGIVVGTTAIVIGGMAYRAKNKRPDAEGLTVVELERAP